MLSLVRFAKANSCRHRDAEACEVIAANFFSGPGRGNVPVANGHFTQAEWHMRDQVSEDARLAA